VIKGIGIFLGRRLKAPIPPVDFKTCDVVALAKGSAFTVVDVGPDAVVILIVCEFFRTLRLMGPRVDL
jgi:hypothetical protein